VSNIAEQIDEFIICAIDLMSEKVLKLILLLAAIISIIKEEEVV
jgi:hypothetical protein